MANPLLSALVIEKRCCQRLILKPSNRNALASRVTTSGRTVLGVGIVVCLSNEYASGIQEPVNSPMARTVGSASSILCENGERIGLNEAYFTVKKFVAALPHLQSSV
ncbi:hypothetical protein, partial [Pseudomonas syringae]|uniref:hypothetical protein n=1 Tax=Pseudomonas syringae TaxID=317 RepID=UPI002180649D